MELWFYHLEQLPLPRVLPALLDKTLAVGKRAFIHSPEAGRIRELDDGLWTWRDNGFLPHGVADRPRADAQPVLLSTEPNNENHAEMVFLLDGAGWNGLEQAERCILMFDGNDEARIANARQQWKQAKGQGLTVKYWKQDESGKWKNMA